MRVDESELNISREEWDKRRRKSIITQMLTQEDVDVIKICMTKKQVENFIKNKKLDIEPDQVYEVLKRKVYHKKICDNKPSLKDEIYNEAISSEDMFPKLYWEEYVHRKTNEKDLTVLENRWKEFDKIKKTIDNTPKLQGVGGGEYQEKYYDMFERTFSMRGWGALMAAYMNSKIRMRKYVYIDFYM